MNHPARTIVQQIPALPEAYNKLLHALSRRTSSGVFIPEIGTVCLWQ